MSSATHPFGEEARNYRHGHKPQGKASGEYITWNGMRARCNNPQNPNYAKYGARGIRVCDRWQSSFINFLEDVGLRPTPDHSLERENNDGNYEPGNCRWATSTEQANNRRSSRLITFDGQTLTLAQWAKSKGLKISTLHARLKCDWPLSRALNQPLKILTRKDSRGPFVVANVYASPFEKIK